LTRSRWASLSQRKSNQRFRKDGRSRKKEVLIPCVAPIEKKRQREHKIRGMSRNRRGKVKEKPAPREYTVAGEKEKAVKRQRRGAETRKEKKRNSKPENPMDGNSAYAHPLRGRRSNDAEKNERRRRGKKVEQRVKRRLKVDQNPASPADLQRDLEKGGLGGRLKS